MLTANTSKKQCTNDTFVLLVEEASNKSNFKNPCKMSYLLIEMD